MLRIHVLRAGKLEDVATLPALDRDTRLWVEVVAPDAGEEQALIDGLGIHRLSLEDSQRIGHPPKLEDFGDHLFLIAHTPDHDDDGGTRKISMFFSANWIVTVARAPLPSVDAVLSRVRAEPKHYLANPAFLAHALLDHMTDGFTAAAEDLQEQLQALEEKILADPDPGVMGSLLELRGHAAATVRIVRGQRDVAQSLARSEHKAITAKIRPYFRDVLDHLLRVYDNLDGLRDGIAAARDTYLSAVNNRLSETMRVLTVIATIMMPLSLVAGIYGMNFERMPGSGNPVGFWITTGVMVLIAIGMLAWFRRRNWL